MAESVPLANARAADLAARSEAAAAGGAVVAATLRSRVAAVPTPTWTVRSHYRQRPAVFLVWAFATEAEAIAFAGAVKRGYRVNR